MYSGVISPPGVTANLHTHTYRCGHAIGDAADYAQAAMQASLQVLGFSDHVPLPDNRWKEVRMHMQERSAYLEAVQAAAEKYPQLTIYAGFECEYFLEYHSYYSELLESGMCDYLIGSVHFIPLDGSWQYISDAVTTPKTLACYTDLVIKTIDSGLFPFIAHPDLFASSYLSWDAEAKACSRAICEAAADKKIPLEINGLGFRKPYVPDAGRGGALRPPYPLKEFWDIAREYDIIVTINSDAHRPEDIAADTMICLDLAQPADGKLTLWRGLNGSGRFSFK